MADDLELIRSEINFTIDSLREQKLILVILVSLIHFFNRNTVFLVELNPFCKLLRGVVKINIPGKV